MNQRRRIQQQFESRQPALQVLQALDPEFQRDTPIDLAINAIIWPSCPPPTIPMVAGGKIVLIELLLTVFGLHSLLFF